MLQPKSGESFSSSNARQNEHRELRGSPPRRPEILRLWRQRRAAGGHGQMTKEQAFAQAQIFKDRAGEAGSLIRASHSSHRRLRAALLALRRAARDARIATEHHFDQSSPQQIPQRTRPVHGLAGGQKFRSSCDLVTLVTGPDDQHSCRRVRQAAIWGVFVDRSRKLARKPGEKLFL